jgi:ABC-type spermidine/putrescine transport system permease subunit II
VGLILIFLFFPLLIVALFSFNGGSALSFPIHSLSLRWYKEVLGNPTFRSALLASLQVAGVSAGIVTVLGTMAALAMTKYRFRGRAALAGLILMPAAIPGLLIGEALVQAFVKINVALSLWTVTAGHVVFTIPFFYFAASARLARFDPLLETVAQDLGAGMWYRFRRVVLPLIAPVIISGAILVIIMSWDEFLITFFTIGTQDTLPLLIWSLARYAINPSVNVIATMLATASIGTVLLFRRWLVVTLR